MLKRLDILLAAPLGLVLFASACESKPCSGGGMAVDERPLPEAWRSNAPPLPDAVACHAEGGETDQEWSRSYEAGANVDDALTKWTAHLTAKGWAKTDDLQDDDIYRQASFEREGDTIELSCSRKVEDKGWCTLVYSAKSG